MPKRKRLADRHVVHEGADLVSDAKELITRMRQLLLADEGDDSPMRFRRSEIAVLDTLGAEGPIVMGQLARRLRLPLSTATRIVNRLVEGKMVRRERLENNRRVVQVDWRRLALGTIGQRWTAGWRGRSRCCEDSMGANGVSWCG